MPLQFIFGGSGSGKTHLLCERVIRESREQPDRNFMVIVPEQFTMQMQKELVMLHPDKGIMNIDVLSFRRLAHRIFEEVGADRRTVLTETGKNLMIRKVAIGQKEKLTVLGGRMNLPGYVSEVKSVLSELMQYEVTDFEIGQMLEFAKDRPLLHAKLTDIRVLYGAFLTYQRDRFMKPEELLDVLCRVAPRSQLLRTSTLAFDGFAGFTPSQLHVLEVLASLSPQMLMTVTIDAREPFYGEIREYELFAPSRKLIRAVSDAVRRGWARRPDAADDGGAFLPPIVLGRNGSPRFAQGSALYHLEQNLFRPVQKVYLDKPRELSLHVSQTPAEEVHFAARSICSLVRREGCRYRDIAVIAGNLSEYDNFVKKIFPMYEVPYFLDETRHIRLNPCLEFVRGALLVVEKDFSYESMFRVLRTGMAGLLPEQTDRLENYVLASGVRGFGRWESEWEYRPDSVTPEGLAACNEYRALVMEKLGPFAQRMRQKSLPLLERAEALCTLLETCGVQQQLKDREQELASQGAREEAKEYSQIYAILIGLIDEMVELLGEEQVSCREFSEILDAGFDDARVGIIPPGIDQVQVGDIERSRLSHVKYLFFLGLNDGWVPARGESGGIVSDMERELLRQTGIELAPSARENSYIQRFYLYQNMTKPEKRLYLSWCAGSGDGAAMRPSYLVAAVRRMFPKLEQHYEAPAGTAAAQVSSKENGLLYLTRGFERVRAGEAERSWLELYRMYLQDDAYCERVRTLAQAAFAHAGHERLTYSTSKALYGETMTNSVTRLEQFASCAFSHFVMYGLRLGERELYGVRPADLGILFHRSMELYSRQLQNEKRDWASVTQQEQEELMERCVDETAQAYGGGALHAGARAEYTVRRLKRILCRTVWALHEQIRAGCFRPTGFEVSFADAGDLEAVNVRFGENGRIRLQGRIDRIDTAEDPDTVYVKIIDYKSGMTQFDPVSLYYGLQLQLVVYLNAALEMERRLHDGKKVVPAGIFYYRMQDPVLEREADVTDEEQQEKLLKKMRPDGVLNDDREILRMLDRGLDGDSLVIPAGLKKNGELKAFSSTASTEQFEQLSGFVANRLVRMGEQILSGDIEVKPVADKNGSACDYCACADVCGFDRKLPGMCEKRLPELTKDEAWERIAQESGVEKDDQSGSET